MFKIKIFIIFFITVFFLYLPAGSAQNTVKLQKIPVVVKQNVQKSVAQEAKKPRPGLTVTPAEVHLGMVSFEKSGEGTFNLKHTGPGVTHWLIQGPEGWNKLTPQKISGTLEKETDSLNVGISLWSGDELKSENKTKQSFSNVEMRIIAGDEETVYTKKLSVGAHKEEIEIHSAGGPKKLSINFIIAYTQNAPLINLTPLKLDMGKIPPNKTVSRKIILNNSGKETLTWSVEPPAHAKEDMPDDFRQGRYMSFVNDEIRGSGIYSVPAPLKETVEFAGKWSEKKGYPSGERGDNLMKINFEGTGIILYLSEYRKDRNLTISLDKQPVQNIKLFGDMEEREGGILIADQLVYGPHVLLITNNLENLMVEGIKILGVTTSFFPAQSIKIFPDSGATTRQTNYLTVSLNTGQAFPGFYEDYLVFKTSNGEAIVEVYAEVLQEAASTVIDVYRYYNGSDYLYTSSPQSETNRLYQNKYMKEGIAFRLFQPDTPGTAGFYRWYHPQKKCHFYHYDPSGGKKDLRGYLFEGSIGNIATSKLTNTRELYRWYNAKTGHYFYSTDLQGGKINKKTYRFDGIAGYVR